MTFVMLPVFCMAFSGFCTVRRFQTQRFRIVDEAGSSPYAILFGADASNYARWSVLRAYPSYLYFWLYSLLPVSEMSTNAKLLNAVLIAATAFPTYALARRYLTAPYAAAFAAIVIISPISSFVRYIMPEPLYFFGFWLTVWVVLSSVERTTLFSVIVGGGLVGLFSLVKPQLLCHFTGTRGFFLNP